MTSPLASVRLRGTELGPGRPRICVPLVASTPDALRDAVAALPTGDVDLVELRADHLDCFTDDRGVDDEVLEAVLRAVETVRSTLDEGVPLLFTFRSAPEGGQRDIEAGDYELLLASACASGRIDAVDIEMFTELAQLERIVNSAHSQGVAVVMSSHDFERTPTREQIVARLRLQQDLGADVVKIAVMPRSAADVLTLLAATEEYARVPGARPAVTMAMGALGVTSRLTGETFGSCLTFGSSGAASAPGQVEVGELRIVLDLIHAAQTG
ncbi:3-dehydroquinate dehydratase [Frondihabitans sp. 762G35]|uniref:type I 3-dehydroquinate dehydratase n=1 Tax=Frondihabitans sp. 762G35 TaxID=1446794 RepID=UPI000D2193E5|nr:type I 3-dehydroquinate dehydratase [Frondihabitans sp. 762G35]ARC57779.1 3-dehydroquinate dehydratase [Frondihabitans sp. 762G35]